MNAKKTSGSIDGIQAVAEMMNHLDPEARERLLRTLQANDPAASEKVRDRMFTFEDLAHLDDTELRKASDEVKAALFRNLTKAAAENLSDAIQALGPQRLSFVEATQREIVALAKTLRK